MSAKFADTRARAVECQTDSNRRQIEANIAYYANRIDQIERRLKELDEEWDIDRVMERNVSVAALLGIALSLFSRKWVLLPLAAAGAMLWHSLEGWNPPLLRWIGVRTGREINQERYALKALRGDFRDLKEGNEDSHDKAFKAMRAAG